MRHLPVFVVAFAVVVAACTPGGDGSSTSTTDSSGGGSSTTLATTTTEPPDGYGGELTVGLDVPIATLNPFSPTSFGERIAGNLVWATVYDIDPDTWERIPDTVAALPSKAGAIDVNEDGTMTVQYEVASGARWSDGTPITGADIAFTAEAMRDLASAGSGGVHPVMATVTETDSVAQVAFITFAEPNLVFEDALWIILPSHALEGVDLTSEVDGADWPSGGPFVVDRFDPFSEARFVRNERYWKVDEDGGSLPYLDAVTITETTIEGLQADEPTAPTEALLAGELDVAPFLPPEDATSENVAAAAANGLVVESQPSAIIEQLAFQFSSARDVVNPDSANDALAYRQAVAHAINRSALLDETGVPWSGRVPGVLIPTGPSDWDRYDYDPTEGRALVDSLGAEAPSAVLATTGNGDDRIRIGDALASSFTGIGVGYEPEYLDSVLFFGDTIGTGAYDLGMWGWVNDGSVSSTLSLLSLLDPANTPPDGNFQFWEPGTDPADRFSEIATEAPTTADPERFRELVAEAEGILADNVVLIPLFNRTQATGYWSTIATGVVPNASPATVTWNVERWQRVGE